MRNFHTTYRMPYGADEMFALAADIETYPEFVPLCEKATVHSRSDEGEGREFLEASLVVGYAQLGIHETFVSDVTLDPADRHIHVFSNKGPVKHLETNWYFHDLDDGSSEIEFAVTYRMRHMPLQLVVGMMFEKAFEKIANAFRARANALYGEHPELGQEATA